MTTASESAPSVTPSVAGPAIDPQAPAIAPSPRRPRRGGRGRTGAAPAPDAKPARHPLLEQLAAWYPRLFGAQPLPLKRGIFEDLIAAHGEIDRAELKQAMGLHARSGRYLSAVAQGLPRHDLAGQVVEAVAPEHVHHALLEVFRRRQQRSSEDLSDKLCARIATAFEASGLEREAYDVLVRGRDERANALLDAALALAGERAARAEALLRAFEASGQSETAFAEMYGLHPREAAVQLARARRARGG